MRTLLLNLNFYVTTNYTKYDSILYKINKYNINYKPIILYIKNLTKKIQFNFKNKINSTNSKNKYSKTYNTSSHNIKKGLIWLGLRQLKINICNSLYTKLLISIIFNIRYKLSITYLEFIKFLYYIKLLKNKNSKLILNFYNNCTGYILNKLNNNLLYNLYKNIHIIY